MKKYAFLTLAAVIGLMSIVVPGRINQSVHAQDNTGRDFVPPTVFQAAGPDAASIQSSVDRFRHELGDHNNGNDKGPLSDGRREINWDGVGQPDATTPPANPFNNFLDSRGNQTTTPGLGLAQGPPSGADGGLAKLFNNETYKDIFKVFSPKRLFTPVGSNITDALFFVPGTGGNIAATVKGFGVVFSDVDQPNGSGPGQKNGNRGASTLVEFFGVDGQLLYSSFVPPSPGDAGFSFFGISFKDAKIASVRITAGDVPGPNDDDKNDIVMMDDFIYGEPQGIPQN